MKLGELFDECAMIYWQLPWPIKIVWTFGGWVASGIIICYRYYH